MAQFTGSIDLFYRYMGGFCRNKVNSISKPYRIKVGKCEFCGKKNHLEAAHIRGKERLVIINEVLIKHTIDEVITIDLEKFETLFVYKHFPIEGAFKILCKSCHSTYDHEVINEESVVINKDIDLIVESKSNAKLEILPIELIPSNIEEFKIELLNSKEALLHMFYNNGKEELKIWHAERFSEKSDVIGNLRSRAEFRKEGWKKSGLIKVVVSVSCDINSII